MVLERRNRTPGLKAARTMLIFSRLPEFLWAEAVATAFPIGLVKEEVMTSNQKGLLIRSFQSRLQLKKELLYGLKQATSCMVCKEIVKALRRNAIFRWKARELEFKETRLYCDLSSWHNNISSYVHPDELCPPNNDMTIRKKTRTRLGCGYPAMDDHKLPSVEKADEMILQDMIQVSLAEHKSREEQEARENVALVYEHLAAEEIKKLVEDPENVDDSSPPRHDEPIYPAPRQQIDQLADIFKNVMMETLPLLVKEKLTKQVRRKFLRQICDQHSNLDALQDEFRRLSAKRQKTSEYEAYVSRESSSGQVNVEEPGPSTSGNQEQDDEFDFWTDSLCSLI
ncbi:hypothetical protein Tco_0564994 [Tanacetum coccineum]